MILAELAMEAGLPDGVLNIIHGTNVCLHILIFFSIFLLHAISNLLIRQQLANQRNTNFSLISTCSNSLHLYYSFLQDTVNAICDDEDIRAVSFVGSNTVSNLLILLYIDYSSVSY